MAPSESYHALLSRVSEEIDDPEQIFGLKNDTAANTARLNVRKVLVTAFHSSLWVLTVAIAILIIFISKSKPTIQQCNEQVSLWSPAVEAVEYIDFDLDNAFDVVNVYRGPPTPEREEAWQNLSYKHAINIEKDKLHIYNRSDVPNLRPAPPEVGGYGAVLEVFHQLHCLNLVRQYTWLQAGQYDNPPGELTLGDVGNRMHVDHCIETLRLALMCSADITPLFILDVDSEAGSRADFNAHHRCRNFSKVDEWIVNNWTVL